MQIDKIKFFIPNENIIKSKRKQWFELFSPNLKKETIIHTKETAKQRFENIKNKIYTIPKDAFLIRTYHDSKNHISVSSTSKGVSFSTNPNVYLYGDNLQIMPFDTIPYLLERISIDLDFDVKTSILTGIDTNFTLSMMEQPKEYMQIIKSFNYFDPPHYNPKTNNLTAKNGYQTISIYDKNFEMQLQNTDSNLLRIELGTDKYISERVTNGTMYLKDLASKKFLNIFMNNYEKKVKEGMKTQSYTKFTPKTTMENLTPYDLHILQVMQLFRETNRDYNFWVENTFKGKRQTKINYLKRVKELSENFDSIDLENELKTKLANAINDSKEQLKNSNLPDEPIYETIENEILL